MNKLILSDCDGVLLEWVMSFQHWIRETTTYELCPEWRSNYLIHEWYGLNSKQGEKLVYDFNNSIAIKTLLPLKNAVEYVTRLHLDHGYEFVAITSTGAKPEAIEWRRHNLAMLFGENAFRELIVTPMHNNKKEYLKQYEPTIWIEDKPENAEVGLDLGFRTFLMEHGHNGDHTTSDEITRVDCWEEIYTTIIGEE